MEVTWSPSSAPPAPRAASACRHASTRAGTCIPGATPAAITTKIPNGDQTSHRKNSPPANQGPKRSCDANFNSGHPNPLRMATFRLPPSNFELDEGSTRRPHRALHPRRYQNCNHQHVACRPSGRQCTRLNVRTRSRVKKRVVINARTRSHPRPPRPQRHPPLHAPEGLLALSPWPSLRCDSSFTPCVLPHDSHHEV